jgi:queuine tRNA-ribosyltransferase
VAALGGLHRFTGFAGPILTDSGGFQVFSLASIRRVTNDGVEFQSHIDGAPLRLDPKTAIDIQQRLGADVIMAFDECPPLPSEPGRLESAVERTIRWAQECRDLHRRADQALFGIVQGGLDLELRERCANAIVSMGFEGHAIGGLSVGETHEQMASVLGPVAAMLPAERPRYLMGVGMPRDILAAVRSGIDMFDCVLPTRNGRNSFAFTAAGPLRLRNECHKLDAGPLEAGCDCEACARFSRGYIRHLFMAGEMLGPTLASIHNLFFYQRFMSRIRDLIREGGLERITDEFPIAAAAVPPD